MDKYGVFWYNEAEILHWTEADFAQKAAEYSAVGVNIVMTFSCTHFRWSFQPWWPMITEALRKLVSACHAQGIRVVEHHSSHLTHNPRSAREWSSLENKFRIRRASLEMFAGLRDWIAAGDPEIRPGVHLSDCRQIDGRAGDFARTVYGGYGHCFNNPDFRAAYFAYLEGLYRTGVDGIMTDDVQYFGDTHACVCRHCRELFHAETGHSLPTPDGWGEFHGDYSNPVFLAWLRFRLRSTERFQREVTAHFRGLGLALLRPNYSATTFGRNAVAYPFEEAADLWSCVFQENMFSSVIRTAWPSWMSMAEQRTALGNRHGVPAMSMFYPAREDDYFFCWSLARCWNHLLMASPEGGDLNGVERLFTPFDREHPILKQGIPLTDYAVLEPRSSLDLTANPLPNVIWPVNAFMQAGTFRNVHQAILFENDTLDTWLKHPLVVVVGAIMLSDGQLDLMRQYCDLGGHLFIYGPLGTKRPDGTDREHPERVFGIEAELTAKRPLPAGEFTWRGQAISLPDVEEGIAFQSISGAGVQVIARGQDGNPWGITALDDRLIWLVGGIRCHRGQDVHSDLRISRWTAQPGQSSAQTNAVSYLRDVPGEILHRILPRPQMLTCSSEDYLCTAYLAGDSSRAVVHLVNVAGVLPQSGEQVSHQDLFMHFLPGAERNREPVTLTLNLPTAAEMPDRAVAHSPEFPGGRTVLCHIQATVLTLTIPAGTFAGYLYIEMPL
ncbi:MAG: hypothetical protein IJJ33_17805 [Victivallales bacterium]|nr:hypothetical protein [Victivallales bacterium]